MLLPLLAAIALAGCQRPGHGEMTEERGPSTADGRTTLRRPRSVTVEGAGGDARSDQKPPVADRTDAAAAGPAKALDPCAERLHALCGPLLFYYLQNRQLPPTLQDLQDGPEPIPPLYCPESRKPYAYLPNSPIPIDNPRGHILIHDPVAAHNGVRWAIVVSAGATPTEPLVAKAIGIREERFAVLRSRGLVGDGDDK